MRPDIFLSLALFAMLGGCAHQIRLDAGATGPALPGGSAIALIGTTRTESPLALQARSEVIAALARKGHVMAADAAARIEIGLTERPAKTGIAVIDGSELSPAKANKFLQSCRDRTYRLVLTYYGAGTSVPVTRAWAEERHCKGEIEDSIRELAERSVAALATGSASQTIRRSGID